MKTREEFLKECEALQQRKFNELAEEFKKLAAELESNENKPDNDIWKPDIGERFYFIYNEFIYNTRLSGRELCKLRIGNFFRTEDEAQKHLDRLVLLQELKEFAGPQDWIDWNDINQDKWSIRFNHDENMFCCCKSLVIEIIGQVYFDSMKSAEKAIDHFGERLKLLL